MTGFTREVECLGGPATGGPSALSAARAVDLEPHVRRALVDAPAVRERLDEVEPPAADVGRGAVARDRDEPDALVDDLDAQLARVLGLDLERDPPLPPYFTEFVMSSDTRSLTSGTTSGAIRSVRASIARRAALGAVGSRGMSKVTVLDMLQGGRAGRASRRYRGCIPRARTPKRAPARLIRASADPYGTPRG